MIYHKKNQPSIGKYTSPMDGMGRVFSGEHISFTTTTDLGPSKAVFQHWDQKLIPAEEKHVRSILMKTSQFV